MPIKEMCRNVDFSDATFYKWRAKFGCMKMSKANIAKKLLKKVVRPSRGWEMIKKVA